MSSCVILVILVPRQEGAGELSRYKEMAALALRCDYAPQPPLQPHAVACYLSRFVLCRADLLSV